jgi:hypothetical protein
LIRPAETNPTLPDISPTRTSPELRRVGNFSPRRVIEEWVRRVFFPRKGVVAEWVGVVGLADWQDFGPDSRPILDRRIIEEWVHVRMDSCLHELEMSPP